MFFLGNLSGFCNRDARFVLICSFDFFDSFDTNLTCLETCLWNPGTSRRKIVRLFSAHLVLVINLR